MKNPKQIESSKDYGRWSDLPLDLLSKISNLLPDLTHKTRFRAVCKPWRASVPAPPAPDRNLCKCTVYYIKSISNPSHKGTILKIMELGNGMVRALQPLSTERHNSASFKNSQVLDLFGFRVYELSKSYKFRVSGKVYRTVAEPGSDNCNEMFVMGSPLCLAYCKFMNGEWSVLENVAPDWDYEDIAYRNGKFYSVDVTGDLLVVDSSSITSFEPHYAKMKMESKYLVESLGELYFLTKKSYVAEYGPCPNEGQMDTFFRVFRLNDASENWERVYELGGCAFFVERCSSFSVALSDDFPALTTNCIYFNAVNDLYGEFNVETGRLVWHSRSSDPDVSPFLWPLRC